MIDDFLEADDGYRDHTRVDGHLDQQLTAADDAWKRSGEEFVESQSRLRAESASSDAAQFEDRPPTSN